MFLVENVSGKFWTGCAWGERGKVFCTIGRAVRSLHENGEDLESKWLTITEVSSDSAAFVPSGDLANV